MRIRRPEPQLERQQPFEAMTHIQLIRHAHAAMQLHRLLPDRAWDRVIGRQYGG